MTCPKCNFQNPEGTLVCQNCKTSLLRKKNVWKVGFFIEFFLLALFIVLIVALTSDNMDLKLKVSTAVLKASQSPPSPNVYPQIASWKTYTNPELGITFQYPSDWEIDDSHGSIYVIREDEKCGEKNNLYECEAYGFYIEEDTQPVTTVSTENANLYVLKFTLEGEKGLDKCMRDTNTLCWGERAIPGLAYLGKEERLFSEQTLFPAAKISTMSRMQSSQYQYYLIKNKRLYLIEILVPDSQRVGNKPWYTDENHPIMKIIKTLKFL